MGEEEAAGVMAAKDGDFEDGLRDLKKSPDQFIN
jgi:hypothetical protein